MEMRKANKKRHDSHSRHSYYAPKPELEEFFESVHERMKSLAIAQRSYRARNDKELTVHPGDFFEVLDDVGTWWCLRAPSGRTGHVPKTHLEIIPNPTREAERSQDQPVDPIVVKVPVIVKASVQHQEVEEKVKSATPKSAPTPPPPAASAKPEPKPAEPPAATPAIQETVDQRSSTAQVPPPPQSIFPPPLNLAERQPYHTVVKEVIREIPPYRHYRRAKSRHLGKREISPEYSDSSAASCSTSSSSGVASWISDGAYERMMDRQRNVSRSRRQKQPQRRSSRKPVPPPAKPVEPPAPSHHSGHCCHGRESNCRYRSVCCYSSNRSRARSTITDVSNRESSKKETESQPQQPMIILLEAPKQDNSNQQAQMFDDQSTEYYDPNSQPQISIVLPPNAQIAPVASGYTPPQTQPNYAQAPTYCNWSPYYYQGYI